MDLMTHDDALMAMPALAPSHWVEPCTPQACSLHHLSPYIEKLKSSLAQGPAPEVESARCVSSDLFCGSGTVPLEAARLG